MVFPIDATGSAVSDVTWQRSVCVCVLCEWVILSFLVVDSEIIVVEYLLSAPVNLGVIMIRLTARYTVL